MAEITPSRRGVFLGAACAFAACSHSRSASARPWRCDDVTAPPRIALSADDREEHRIFMLLAMAMTFDAWGVNRARPDLVAAYEKVEPGRTFGNYLGHNIGGLLVDERSNIVNFALNRSVLLNSTLEHAEARAVRSAIEKANAGGRTDDAPNWTYGSLLKAHRLYATLAPCQQCAGIAALARLGTIVYAQDDPAQNNIVNVLYNLDGGQGGSTAPFPLRADFLPYWDKLNRAGKQFARSNAGKPNGATAFLESVDAYAIFRSAAADFDTMAANGVANRGKLAAARAFRARSRGEVREGPARESGAR